MSSRVLRLWKASVRLFAKEIWNPALLNERSLRGRCYACLRVIAITWNVFTETNAASRAAALTFSSLLGLAPLLAIAFAIAGFVIGEDSSGLAVTTVNKIIELAAPQVSQSGAESTGNPQMAAFLQGVIESSRSAPAGVVGALTLIVIAVQLFTSIENTFNEIWGVRQGRSWFLRIVFYWTLLTLGSVLFFGAVALQVAGAFVSIFDVLPLGSTLHLLFDKLLPLLSLFLLIGLLTLFYRFIPNTRVRWVAAFAGATVVAVVLVLNNVLSFLYFNRVFLTQSLYGSLSVPIILMFGLYFFWLFVLVGCQISYAIQNAAFRSSRAAWSSLTLGTRERLSLVVLLTIARRFASCLPPASVSQLSKLIKLPAHVLNESLNRLVDLGLVTPLPPDPDQEPGDNAYQPSRPLNRITLGEFRKLFSEHGDDPVGETIERIDPLIPLYRDRASEMREGDLLKKPLDQLLADVPIDGSAPPLQTFSIR